MQDEKDRLIAEIKLLAERPPAWIGSAGIRATRTWVEASRAALKVVANSRASVPALKEARNVIRSAIFRVVVEQ